MSDAYQLVQLKNGAWSVRSTAEGETFHPVIGPVAEAEALYVRQLRLAERAALIPDSESFVLWDVGLGAAANVLTALRSLREVGRTIEVISFDCTIEPLRFAVSHAEALGYPCGFQDVLSTLVERQFVEFPLGASRVIWRIIQDDFPRWLASTPASACPAPHGILFDAFSPARNPAMWTLPVFQGLRHRASAGRPCALATYSRATLVRVTLLLAGWYVGVGHATGEKDETTVASTVPELVLEPLDAAWLNRARRSTSAEPMVDPEYRQRPLSESSWKQLQDHPQFR